MIRIVFLVLAALAAAGPAAGQQRPYAGLEQRAVKALSAEQIADLKAGRGMGLALAAELNGYPGPLHVIELGRELDLSQAQRDRVQALLEAMKAEAVPLGERVIAQEAALDRAFAQRTITAERLAAATAEIGATQGALRAAHLKYHLLVAEVLTPAQMQHYAALRGYGTAGPQPGHGGHRRAH
jgi:Spy/CpxP family protein refolding chaperone